VGPDDREVEAKDRFCFMEQSRPCDPTCLAHTVYVPEGKAYEGQQWAHCLVLVNLEKASRHVVALAQHGQTLLLHADNLLKFLKVKQADDRRGPPPAPPRGG
jgi:hypothetical protein